MRSEQFQVNTAVLFLVFNRPQTTQLVFEAIKRVKPPRLYVAADGPRHDRPGEVERCETVRRIATNVDWPCEVKALYQETNLGCKMAVSSAINWFFLHEEAGIILEDDCVPHVDFFRFCEELLHRYAHDARVAVITGNNFQNGRQRGNASYYFSKYNHCWGWATWRRAWKCYQGDIPFWPEWRLSDAWRQLTPDIIERLYWNKIFERVRAGRIDSWAYPWTASVWFNGGLTATPNVNLVSNIGFGSDATHTTSEDSPLAGMPTYELGDLTHPDTVMRDVEADRYVFDHVFGGRNYRFPYVFYSLPRMVAGKLVRMISNKKSHG